jgi:hypothetical protein
MRRDSPIERYGTFGQHPHQCDALKSGDDLVSRTRRRGIGHALTAGMNLDFDGLCQRKIYLLSLR